MPTPTKVTLRLPATVQTLGVDEVTEVAPSPSVATLAVKFPPKAGLTGMFETVGGDGVARPTVTFWELPSAAA